MLRKLISCAIVISFVTYVNASTTTPIFDAAQWGNSAEVRRLLDINPYLIVSHDYTRNGATLLHIAVDNADFSLMDLLLAREGVNLEAPDDRGATPLHVAIESSHPLSHRVVKELLSNGANPNTAWGGRLPVNMAVKKRDYMKVWHLLNSAHANFTFRDDASPVQAALQDAAVAFDPYMLSILHTKAAIDIPDYKWETPLEMSLKNFYPKAVVYFYVLSGASITPGAADQLNRQFPHWKEETDLIRQLARR